MKFIKVIIPTPLKKSFDYLPPQNAAPQDICIGSRVLVPFGSREVVGIVWGYSSSSNVPANKLKKIKNIIDSQPIITTPIIALCKKAANYYHHSIGEVVTTGFPAPLKKGKPFEFESKNLCQPFSCNEAEHILTPEQKTATEVIVNSLNSFSVFLLEGVTGSGKTEVYLQTIAKALEKGLSALVLVPEISLTPQTIKRFEKKFTNGIVSYHSRMTPKAKTTSWHNSFHNKARIVIGTRSAIFMPMPKLGIIILDEEHDPSFKQQTGFRYHARDLAVLRSQIENIPIVLGSATPSFESVYNVNTKKYNHLVLPNRVGNAKLPTVGILDVRHNKLKGGLSAQLLKSIEEHLTNKGQVLLFLNRRGYSPRYMCFSCGWIASCNRCDVPLTYHRNSKKLSCHHCDRNQMLFGSCPKCSHKELFPIGIGTERLEETLTEHFPDINITRIDSDTTKTKGSLEKFLDKINSGETQILIGTQLLAKGHHFPNLTLVALIDVDGGLYSTDFRAIERMGQLITQVCGRAGREKRKGQVILQTHNPEHPILHKILQQNYPEFTEFSLEQRKKALLPPFSFMALIRAQSTNQEKAKNFLIKIRELGESFRIKEIQAMGPVPAPMEKKLGSYGFQLLIQSHNRKSLQNHLRKLSDKAPSLPDANRLRWSIDVDPIEFT